jgi:hypothetical protein
LLVEKRGGQSAKACANNNQIVNIGIWLNHWAPIFFARPGKLVRYFKRAGMTASQLLLGCRV